MIATDYCWQHGKIDALHEPHGPGNGLPWTRSELAHAHPPDVDAERAHWMERLTGDPHVAAYARAMVKVIHEVWPSLAGPLHGPPTRYRSERLRN